MQLDARLHHQASAGVLQCIDALHYHGFVCHRRTTPVGGMTFPKVMVSGPSSKGASSELCTCCCMPTAHMGTNKCMCTHMFKLHSQECDLTPESCPHCIFFPLTHIQLLCLQYGGWLGDSNCNLPQVMEAWRYGPRRQASATEREPFSGVMAGMTCMLRQTAAGCSAVWICYHSHMGDSVVQWRGIFSLGHRDV